MEIRGSPFWFGNPQIGLGIYLIQIPILVRGSPFWYGDSGIPVLVWESPNHFGDSFDLHPHIGSGIPILVRRFGDPRFGLGIPKSVWGFICILVRGSPFWYGDSGIPVLVWGSPNWFGDSFDLHPHIGLGIPVLVWRFGDPRFGLGIPKSVWGSI